MNATTIRVDGGPVNVYLGGDPGHPAVMLLHGGGTDNARLSWADTFPALAAHYYVIAPDYPGYGGTPRTQQPSTTESLLDFLAALTAALELDDLRLVGISMGGALALGYTLRHPEQVERLALVGSYGLADRAPAHALSALFVRLPWVNELSWWVLRRWRAGVAYTVGQIVRSPEARTDALIDAVFEAVQDPSAQRAFAEFQQDEVRWGGLKTNYTDRLHEIAQPVMLVHGSEDIGVPLAAAERAAGRLPDAELHVFEGAGHWTQRDQPARFNDLLLRFLADEASP